MKSGEGGGGAILSLDKMNRKERVPSGAYAKHPTKWENITQDERLEIHSIGMNPQKNSKLASMTPSLKHSSVCNKIAEKSDTTSDKGLGKRSGVKMFL